MQYWFLPFTWFVPYKGLVNKPLTVLGGGAGGDRGTYSGLDSSFQSHTHTVSGYCVEPVGKKASRGRSTVYASDSTVL